MPDEQQPGSANQQLTTEIVAAYVRRNPVATDQLASLISTIHQALVGLSGPAGAAETPRTPAVSVRRSVHRDYVVCLDCGWKGQMLKRHLTAAHGLTAREYLRRWNLPREHALTAPAYSERRSGLAKQIGFGRVGRTSATNTDMAQPEAGTRASTEATETTSVKDNGDLKPE